MLITVRVIVRNDAFCHKLWNVISFCCLERFQFPFSPRIPLLLKCWAITLKVLLTYRTKSGIIKRVEVDESLSITGLNGLTAVMS